MVDPRHDDKALDVLVAEIGNDIAVPFQDGQDLQRIIQVVEEYHVTSKRQTSQTGTEFRAVATELARKRGEFLATIDQLCDKPVAILLLPEA
jgi:hypothetical protein